MVGGQKRRFSKHCFAEYYGLLIKSQWPLPYSSGRSSRLPGIELSEGSARFFSEAAASARFRPDGDGWFRVGDLSSGDTYLRWKDLFEFVISADGLRIISRKSEGAAFESFQTYLLNQVLSFALIKRGIESLHATAMVVRGKAVAWVGHSGQGKSTLAAAFLGQGIPLLTDDLLVLREEQSGWWAVPGLPRVKLYPDIAKAYLGEKVRGTRMNPLNQKRIIPLRKNQFVRAAAPLQVVYILDSSYPPSHGDPVQIEPISENDAFLAMIQHVFNTRVVEPERLKRHFEMSTRLVRSVPVRTIRYPRDLALLPKIRDAILADLER